MKCVHALCFVLACSAAAPPLIAQETQLPTESKAKMPQGTVTGSVYCADTNQPARLAQVTLLPASEQSSGRQLTAVTDLEGHFAIRHVADGKYYVAATLPGYLNLGDNLSDARLASMTPEERKFFDVHVPTVAVSARQAGEVSLRLERAAEIDGTVQYDDGSPAISLHVDLKPVHRHEASSSETQSLSPSVTLMSLSDALQHSTDDHGHFRILGVSPGEYRVSVTVPSAIADSNGHPLVQMVQASSLGAFKVYAGNTLRAGKGKIIKIGAGDSAKDADITIPLSTLHSIRGTVVLKSTGQPPPAAYVQLLYADTKEVARVALAPDGEFEIPYVPQDSFILRATATPDPLPELNDELGDAMIVGENQFSFDESQTGDSAAEVPLLVAGDVTGITISVPDPTPNKMQAPAMIQGDADQSGMQTVAPQ